ncbi:MAG: DUF3048 domain-containing protein [Candidatus Kerfeldbacteria bacterium]
MRKVRRKKLKQGKRRKKEKARKTLRKNKRRSMGKPPLSIRIKDSLWAIKESKKAQVWLVVAAIGLLVVIVVVSIYIVNRSHSSEANGSGDTVNIDLSGNDTDEDVLTRRIDGVPTPRGYENVLPIAIMIENLVTVRPQTGLQSASVVYEALAEGGITRFMALYATNENLTVIGPVRSARHYFVDWAEEYRGVYMHAGGSPQALGQLIDNSYLLDNVNQVGGDHAYFWRDESIAAPHNLFTSSEMIGYMLRDFELEEGEGTFNPWLFESAIVLNDRPLNAPDIVIPFSTQSYEVRYAYDRDANQYLRFNGNEPHNDTATGQQIHVTNVLIQYVPTTLMEESTGRLDMETIGEGAIDLFKNGERIQGRWIKEYHSQRTRFITDSGEEMTFTPGNTWIEILPDDRSVEYN